MLWIFVFNICIFKHSSDIDPDSCSMLWCHQSLTRLFNDCLRSRTVFTSIHKHFSLCLSTCRLCIICHTYRFARSVKYLVGSPLVGYSSKFQLWLLQPCRCDSFYGTDKPTTNIKISIIYCTLMYRVLDILNNLPYVKSYTKRDSAHNGRTSHTIQSYAIFHEFSAEWSCAALRINIWNVDETSIYSMLIATIASGTVLCGLFDPSNWFQQTNIHFTFKKFNLNYIKIVLIPIATLICIRSA